jgi:hypothetical protein
VIVIGFQEQLIYFYWSEISNVEVNCGTQTQSEATGLCDVNLTDQLALLPRTNRQMQYLKSSRPTQLHFFQFVPFPYF